MVILLRLIGLNMKTPKIHKSKVFLSLLIALCSVSISFGQTYYAEGGYIEFISTAPLLEFKGVSDHLTGKIDFDENTVDFYVDLNTISTGNNRRDRDMRNVYLKTDKFPFAEFFGKMIEMVDLDRHEKQAVAVEGSFKIHNVANEMEISGYITPGDDSILVEASWKVLLGDHNIDRPSVVFYELSDTQNVNIKITLKKQ